MSRKDSQRHTPSNEPSSAAVARDSTTKAGADAVCESASELAVRRETRESHTTVERPLANERSDAAAEPSAADDRDDSAAPQSTTRAPSAHWRQILCGASPREVLARLMSGDPLRIRALVAIKLRERCYLCDADRVFMRSIARAARFAVRYRGQPDIEPWLGGIVDEALLDMLRDDLEAERAGAAVDEADIAAFVDLARPLGLEPLAMRSVCNAFNHLPEVERRAFHVLVIEGRTLDVVARETGQSATEIARAARRALDTLLALHNEKGTAR